MRPTRLLLIALLLIALPLLARSVASKGAEIHVKVSGQHELTLGF